LQFELADDLLKGAGQFGEVGAGPALFREG
jgi:hypothetical protein